MRRGRERGGWLGGDDEGEGAIAVGNGIGIDGWREMLLLQRLGCVEWRVVVEDVLERHCRGKGQTTWVGSRRGLINTFASVDCWTA